MSSVYHAALAFFPKLSYRRYKKLAAYFINFEKVWTATSNDLIKSGLEPGFVQEFVNWRNQKPLDYYLDVLEKENITTVSLPDANYPKILKEITDPPHTLFIRGCLPNQSLPALAVVGTRKSTPYGKQICEDIVEPLAKQAKSLLTSLGYQTIQFKTGDGYQGWEEHAPFDGIMVTAAPKQIPQPLVEQLKEGGRMVIPVGDQNQTLMLLTKKGGVLHKKEIIPVRFVPMTGEALKK